MDRIIGRYIGEEKGPLFITLAAMHGNELAGVHAVKRVLELLRKEAIREPDFVFCGQFVGMYGNVQAVEEGKRFLEKDLNRQLTDSNIEKVMHTPSGHLHGEDLELKELLQGIQREVERYQPEKLIFLDLHTTTASGGIFSIVSDELRSLQIAVQLHAPVITGMLEGLDGTTLHYFTTDHFGVETIAVTFESGQHNDPESTDRAISAIINCMRTIECVQADIVEHRHDDLLIEYSRKLPKVTELLYVHKIKPEDQFKMRAGYQNFNPIKKGEVLAEDKNGVITSPYDGFILMPLYQSQGEDGFFLVKEMYQGTF